MTLTKREEFVVLYTALLLIPERNLDYDSKQRMLQCAALAIAGELGGFAELHRSVACWRGQAKGRHGSVRGH